MPVRADRVQPTLAQLLGPKKVLCRRRAAGWEDAVRQACEVLVRAGDVTEEFTRSAIQSVRGAGPYIVIMPGVALVHSEMGKGVKRLAMSLVTFENDVCFHHPTNDPVRLVDVYKRQGCTCTSPLCPRWSRAPARRVRKRHSAGRTCGRKRLLRPNCAA